MFGSGVLGVAIGLILIYLLLSFASSGINEILEGVILHQPMALDVAPTE